MSTTEQHTDLADAIVSATGLSRDHVAAWLSKARQDPTTPPPRPAPLTTDEVDRFLHQVELDRARPYWSDRTTQLDGVQSWLESLRDHLDTGPRHATPEPAHQGTIRLHCGLTGCSWWVETGSFSTNAHMLGQHRRTDHP